MEFKKVINTLIYGMISLREHDSNGIYPTNPDISTLIFKGKDSEIVIEEIKNAINNDEDNTFINK